MIPEFVPFFKNPHIATIAGNYWHRRIDEVKYPARRIVHPTAPAISVVAYEHQPVITPAKGQVVLLHGLEGSSDGGYIVSLSQAALDSGYGVHRLNLRSCGGTEELSETMYHSGLTSDTLHVLEQIRASHQTPIFLVGFSLGGNVALKLAGELGENDLLHGVCAVSTPIDLAAAVKAIGKPQNIIYSSRFLSRLKERVRRKNQSSPHLYPTDKLNSIHSIWEFDDRYTAPLFGFGSAENYYRTQSSAGFLAKIKTPTLVVTAQNDPLVPFSMYRRPEFEANPALTLIAPRYGGHLGFLSRGRPRFWLDQLLMSWINQRAALGQNVVFGPAHLH